MKLLVQVDQNSIKTRLYMLTRMYKRFYASFDIYCGHLLKNVKHIPHELLRPHWSCPLSARSEWGLNNRDFSLEICSPRVSPSSTSRSHTSHIFEGGPGGMDHRLTASPHSHPELQRPEKGWHQTFSWPRTVWRHRGRAPPLPSPCPLPSHSPVWSGGQVLPIKTEISIFSKIVRWLEV